MDEEEEEEWSDLCNSEKDMNQLFSYQVNNIWCMCIKHNWQYTDYHIKTPLHFWNYEIFKKVSQL